MDSVTSHSPHRLLQENAKLRMLLQSQTGGVLVPPIMFSSLTDNHRYYIEVLNMVMMSIDWTNFESHFWQSNTF